MEEKIFEGRKYLVSYPEGVREDQNIPWSSFYTVPAPAPRTPSFCVGMFS